MKIRRSLSIAMVAVASTAVIGSAIALPPVLEKIEQSNLVKALEEQAAKRDTPAPEVPSDAELTEALKSEEGKKELSKKIEKAVKQGRKHVDEREADLQEADEHYVAVDEDYAARKAEADRLAEEAAQARQAQQAAQQANAGVAAELYRNSGNDAAQLLVDEEAINKQARSEKYADSAAQGAQASEHKAQALENVAEQAAEAKREAETLAEERVEKLAATKAAAKAHAATVKTWKKETFPKLVEQYAKAKGITIEEAEDILNDMVDADIEEFVRKAVEASADDIAKLETDKDKKALAEAPDPTETPDLNSVPTTPATTPPANNTKQQDVGDRTQPTSPESESPAASKSAAAKDSATQSPKPPTTRTKAPASTPPVKQSSTNTKQSKKPKPSPTPTKTAVKPKPTPTPTPTPTKTAVKPKPKPTTTVKPAATTGSWQSKAVSYAVAVTQNPSTYYVLGGNGPNGYDCSGLVQQAFAAGGKYISARTAQAQFNAGPTKIPLKQENLLPGDLVFWGNQGNLWHVAIYIGNGKIAHARNPQAGITVTDLYYSYNDPYPVAVRY